MNVELVLRTDRETHTLRLDTPKTVGRDKRCDLVVSGHFIDKKHARLEASSVGVFVVDERSTSGTYVNDKLCHGAHPLAVGDHIAMGGARFTVVSITR